MTATETHTPSAPRQLFPRYEVLWTNGVVAKEAACVTDARAACSRIHANGRARRAALEAHFTRVRGELHRESLCGRFELATYYREAGLAYLVLPILRSGRVDQALTTRWAVHNFEAANAATELDREPRVDLAIQDRAHLESAKLRAQKMQKQEVRIVLSDDRDLKTGRRVDRGHRVVICLVPTGLSCE